MNVPKAYPIIQARLWACPKEVTPHSNFGLPMHVTQTRYLS